MKMIVLLLQISMIVSIHSRADSATSDIIIQHLRRASDECFQGVQAENGNNDDVSTSSLAKEDNNPTADADDKLDEIQSQNDPNSKGHPIEKQFQVLNTANQYKDVILQPHNYVLLILEVIYLWGAIRICGDHQLRQFLIETERSQESYISSLQVFMLGILHLQLRDIQLAEQYLKEAVRISKKSRQDNYIAPYATYELGLLLTEHAQGVSQGKSLLNQAKRLRPGKSITF
ncbi:uncharacterized protein TRIADDRAFT_61071 [Trichoplax adhaerens]|uniref:MalT-like TPR region domain-containing protein n=1 Tax=Trichoplax adhaerens TaxID=10228 RepID=B3S9Y6_TRIAD|nr:hypothetical protein TRIADDRAFT_61071 [Trichoplax adhaerens]EDV20347.1 hypothetical protein TRIADDRAFT_61071 [Trichoplax adhaerens]|eukprot:XP_002117041.1 hypothetical protein TRIADDRAFT_61071 [Trichoplax adhaerens]